MGLKKRTKVNAEFSMSSLTDIIFLLLIFFMLTSTVVAPNALNLKLPGRTDTPASPSQRNLDNVRIDARGEYSFNGRKISLEALASTLRDEAKPGYAMLISPDDQAPNETVVAVMDLAKTLNINGVLAADR